MARPSKGATTTGSGCGRYRTVIGSRCDLDRARAALGGGAFTAAVTDGRGRPLGEAAVHR